MLLIVLIQSISMARRNHFRLTLDTVIKMLYEQQDEENEEAILGLDSESILPDADDLDYVPQHQSRVVFDVFIPMTSKEPSFDVIGMKTVE